MISRTKQICIAHRINIIQLQVHSSNKGICRRYSMTASTNDELKMRENAKIEVL